MIKDFRSIFVTLFLFIGLASTTLADTKYDLSVSSQYRSYPIAGGAAVEFGVGHTIWGSNKNPFYGYARAALKVEGVEDFFSGTATFDFFPISFLGIRIGHTQSQSHLDYQDYDCQTFVCRGHFTENFIEAPLFLKWRRLLFSGVYRTSDWAFHKPSTTTTFYMEPTSGIPLLIDETEKSVEQRYTLMAQISDKIRLGYHTNSWQVTDQGQSSYENRKSQSWLVVSQFMLSQMWGPEFAVTLGAGEFNGYLHTTEPTVVCAIHYAPFKKLGY